MVVSVLEEMRIRSLGVIDDAVVELSPGFTAVTGETGAGKTMVVTSLGLLLGGRADAALVRIGAKNAVVEGRIAVPGDAAVAVRAEEAGAELDDGALLISRTVSSSAPRRTCSTRNFGAKSIDEVKAKLAGMGLALKDSPPGFDPTAAADAFGADDDADAGFVETEQY